MEVRSRVRLVEPTSLMPDWFGKKEWSELEDFWSGAFTAETRNEECSKQKAADLRVELSRLQCDERNGPRVATLPLISRSEGEVLEVIRGAERELSLEQ